MSAAPLAQPRALIYLRVSKAEQLEGYSPDAMEARCREKAAALGATVVGVLLESGKGNNWNLPKLNESLEMAKRGDYDILLSYDSARLARDSSKRKWIKGELTKHHAAIRYATVEYADTPEGRLQEGVMSDFDEYEREKIGMRTANGIRQKLDEGHVVGNGRTPYGYEPVYRTKGSKQQKIGYRPKMPEAGIVRRIVTELAAPRGTMLAVCARLNADGVPTPGGGRCWESGTIGSLLRNTAYIGEYRFGQTQQETRGDTVVKIKADPEDVRVIAIPPIVTRAELAAARAALTRRRQDRRPRRPAAEDPFILRGLVRCGYCEGVLSCTVNNGYARYTCLRAYGPGVAAADRCPLPQIAADALELHAWDALIQAFSRDTVMEQVRRARDGGEAVTRHRAQIASVKADMARMEQRIKNAVARLTTIEPGSLSEEAFERQRVEAERARKELHASLMHLEQSAPPMLTDTDEVSLRAWHGELLAGIQRAGVEPAARRERLRQCQATGTVRLAEAGEAGVLLGRKHRYVVGWAGIVSLSGSAKEPHGCLVLWDSSDAGVTLDLRATA